MGKRKSCEQGKSTSKKSKTFSQKEAKAIARLAKKAVLSHAETKVAYATISGSVQDTIPKSWNCVYQTGITQGTEAENSKIIGNKFDLVGIKFRGNLLNNSSSTLLNQNALVTLAFVETEVFKTVTSLAADDIFPDYSPITYPPRFDASKCRVLGKKQVILRNLISGVQDYQPVDFYVPYKRTVELTANSNGAFGISGKQIYLVMFASTQNAGTSFPVFHNGFIEMFYKDI